MRFQLHCCVTRSLLLYVDLWGHIQSLDNDSVKPRASFVQNLRLPGIDLCKVQWIRVQTIKECHVWCSKKVHGVTLLMDIFAIETRPQSKVCYAQGCVLSNIEHEATLSFSLGITSNPWYVQISQPTASSTRDNFIVLILLEAVDVILFHSQLRCNICSLPIYNHLMDYFNVPIPVVPPPPGVTPNFIHPASRTNVAVAVCTSVLVVTFILFGVRVYTRLKITRSFGHDDCKLPSPGMKL